MRGSLKLGDGVYVHPQHEKWVLSLWLCLHLREIERGREAVPAEHVAIYRAAIRCVLQQLEGAHAHVVSHLKKNNVFACALSDWHSPLECSVTRRDYRDNPDVLFALLSKALPNAEWARVEWIRGRVERVTPVVWPIALPV